MIWRAARSVGTVLPDRDFVFGQTRYAEIAFETAGLAHNSQCRAGQQPNRYPDSTRCRQYEQ